MNTSTKEDMVSTKDRYKRGPWDRACWGAEYHSQEWWDEADELERKNNETTRVDNTK